MRYWTPIAKLAIGIPPGTLRDWCRKGRIQAKKLGKNWYVHLPSLNKQFASLLKANAEDAENTD